MIERADIMALHRQIDTLVDERDKWQMKAGSWRKIEEDTLERLGTAEARVVALTEALAATDLRVGTVLMALLFISEEHRSNFHRIASSELIEAQDIARTALKEGVSLAPQETKREVA